MSIRLDPDERRLAAVRVWRCWLCDQTGYVQMFREDVHNQIEFSKVSAGHINDCPMYRSTVGLSRLRIITGFEGCDNG